MDTSIGIQADFGDLPPAPPNPPPPPPIGKPPPPNVPPPKSATPSPKRSTPSPERSTPSPKTSKTPSPKRSPTPSPKRSKTPSPERSPKAPTPVPSSTPSPAQSATPPNEIKPSTSAAKPQERPMSETSRDDSLLPRSNADHGYGDRASSHFSDWTYPNDCAVQVTSHDLDNKHRYFHSEVTMNDHTSSTAVTLEKKLLTDDIHFADKPANYLPLTICCIIINPLFGLMACFASLISIREYKKGNVKDAKRHGRNAAILALVAFLATVVIIVIALSIILSGAVGKAVAT